MNLQPGTKVVHDAVTVRVMQPDDLASVAAIQAHAYPPHFQEDDATLYARLNSCADTAWVAQGEQGMPGSVA